MVESKDKKLVNFSFEIPNAIFRRSKRGVPHIVVGSKFSICWFGTKKMYRIFDGYATPNNHKVMDCKTYDEVIKFFQR